MMSGCGILTNGKGTRREYGEYNLDELQEGDRIGLIRKSSGALHYYINGQDQGVAASRTAEVVWGVVDLYGMAVKVTILDPSDPSYPGHCESETVTSRVNHYFRQFNRETTGDTEEEDSSIEEVEKLLFHPQCGSHATVIGTQRTAHRPNALDDFNNGVVLTNRTLRPNEVFEVRLDKMVDKWAGSIDIGVTTHCPTDLDFPSTMTNIRSGTWMMTGNGVMHNGTTVIDDYGRNLDQLKESDRVGVCRHADGTLLFFVNGVSQGIAATNVPASVYGVIDLYGQAAQATIVDQSDPQGILDLEHPVETNPEDLQFHHMHGRNATISPDGRTASRPNARGEFNDAIIMSNRPLRDNELFEVTIDTMVDRWSGSIEAGVTLIQPEDLDFPNTMTDIDYDTWMLSGSAIMQDGSTIRNGYRLDLDSLVAGSRIGMMHCSDGTLHFYLDGKDQGVACTDLPSGVYAVIDLYGQCAQVTLTSGSEVQATGDNQTSPKEVEPPLTSPVTADTSHRFSQCCGKNITIRNNGCTACRVRSDNHGLVFSVDPLRADELFEVKIDQMSRQWSGSLQIGLTTMAISDTLPLSVLPATATDLRSKVTWVVIGSEVMKNGITLKENYCPSLERLQVEDRVGVKRCSDSTMHICINGEDLGVAASGVPKNTFALVDLYGLVDQITVTSTAFAEILDSSRPPSIPISESTESMEEEQDRDTAEPCYLEFHPNHGKNIHLKERHLVATRTASYNQGIVLSHKPLARNHILNIRLDKLNPRWTSSLIVGVVGFPPDKSSLPVCALNIKKLSWIIYGNSVFHSGVKIKEHYGPNLDSLQTGHVIGIMVDDDNALHMYINGVDQGIAARDISATCYALVDLYGQCEQVAIVTDNHAMETVVQTMEYKEKAVMEDGVKEKLNKVIDPVVKNCEFQNMCNRFRTSLGIPEGYFTLDSNRCYCETCHKVRGDEPYFKVGEPPMDYALPFGWCKFGLRVHPKVDHSQVLEKWHIAYHGGKVSTVRKVLDSGDLLAPASSLSITDSKNKQDEVGDVKTIPLSPSVRYAACLLHAPRYEFRDPRTKKTLYAQVSYQVRVKPGTYKIGAQTIGANEQIDPKFHNNEVQWSTRDRSAIVLSALLFKIEQ